MEHFQEQKDAISEFYKLKQRLTLTKKEHNNWENYQYYTHNAHLYRKCNCCGKVKLKTEFYGRYAYCKTCKIIKSKMLYYKKKILLFQNKIKKYQDKIIKLGAKNDK